MNILTSKAHIYLTLVLSSLLAIELHAQSNEEEQMVSVDFQIIAWGNQIDNVFYDSLGKQSLEIKAYGHIRSSIYEYKGPQTLTFYRKKIASANKTERTLVGTLQIQPKATKLLLMFSQKSNGTYDIVQLPDDIDSFPYGSFKFFNLTEHPIAAMLQDEKLLIEPKKQKLRRISGNKDGSNLRVRIALGKPEGWKIFYTNGWGHNENRRTLVIIFKDDKGRHKVKRFREERPRSS